MLGYPYSPVDCNNESQKTVRKWKHKQLNPKMFTDVQQASNYHTFREETRSSLLLHQVLFLLLSTNYPSIETYKW